ncbi:serine protease domain protein [Mycobacterium xenopi 4042]|uniref:Serine protease domain protein n=1 Tax=Mycobacterium xenopi 4042 TaxID=1299334 RepID=X8BFN3_MYCXE|nr:serine protease domain protein [Mycobacterium xenopi 4042]
MHDRAGHGANAVGFLSCLRVLVAPNGSLAVNAWLDWRIEITSTSGLSR